MKVRQRNVGGDAAAMPALLLLTRGGAAVAAHRARTRAAADVARRHIAEREGRGVRCWGGAEAEPASE